VKRVAIVMAGGSGERFWPLSTPDRPKQLLDLTGSGKCLLEEAIRRVEPVVDAVYVSTTERLRQRIVDAKLVDESHVLAEPAKRNTAGALVWCMATLIAELGEPFVAAITTADHAISPDTAFEEDVAAAISLAESQDVLVTIGISPTRADTGFGYLEKGPDGTVLRFTEKPDLATAEAYVRSGSFLWNSGMFFWRSDVFASSLAHASAAHAASLNAVIAGLRSGDVAAARASFETLPNLSIDYALMERADNVRFVPASFSWDDLGTWDALLRTLPLDAHGNASIGDVLLIDSSDCVCVNTTRKPLAVIGQRAEIVVASDDGFLAVPLDHAQDVRDAAVRATR